MRGLTELIGVKDLSNDKEFEKFEEFIEVLKRDLKDIIEYVKENEDVFLGIRENYINLYVDGGCILKLDIRKRKDGYTYKASFDEKYYNDNEKMKQMIKNIDNQDIKKWIELLPTFKQRVKEYQRGKCKKNNGKNVKTNKEKILQQQLLFAFNQNSNYFAYDIEYAIKSAQYRLEDLEGNPIKSPITAGRADILLISIPDENNEITIYSMEVKQGTGALGGVSDQKEATDKNGKKVDKRTFGSGIAGHLKNNVKIIKAVRSGKPYDGIKQIPLRENILQEIKAIMLIYDKLGLISNPHFRNVDWKNIKLKNGNKAMELVFFLGDYKKSCPSFENYLGINCPGEAKYSVRKLLLDSKEKRKLKDYNLDLKFMTYDEMIDDFKVWKTDTCYDKKINSADLDIENYKIIKKESFKVND